MSNAIEDLFDSIEDVASEAVEAQQLLYTVEDELLKLKRENKKLRELVKDMCKAFVYGNCYQWCEPKEPCDYITDGTCQWCKRMRELVIEVE